MFSKAAAVPFLHSCEQNVSSRVATSNTWRCLSFLLQPFYSSEWIMAPCCGLDFPCLVICAVGHILTGVLAVYVTSLAYHLFKFLHCVPELFSCSWVWESFMCRGYKSGSRNRNCYRPHLLPLAQSVFLFFVVLSAAPTFLVLIRISLWFFF